MIKSIEYTNSYGESIIFKKYGPFAISTISGLSHNDTATQTNKGFEQQGVYLYGTNEGPRIINMRGLYIGKSREDATEKRRELIRILNTSCGPGRITLETNSEKYIIDAQVYSKIDFEPIPKTCSEEFDVIFICPKPDWLSYDIKQKKMDDFLGGLTFPIKFPIKFAERGEVGNIVYEGDNPANVVLDFRVAVGGTSAENPKVENQLGEYIQLDITLTPGQKILIDTNPDAPSITFIDEYGEVSDAWNSLVRGSTFFQMYPDEYNGTVGLNEFSFTAASGDPELYLNYRIHYAGI